MKKFFFAIETIFDRKKKIIWNFFFFTKGKKILIKGSYKRYNNINTQNIKKIFPENKNFQRKKKFERKKVNRKKSQF